MLPGRTTVPTFGDNNERAIVDVPLGRRTEVNGGSLRIRGLSKASVVWLLIGVAFIGASCSTGGKSASTSPPWMQDAVRPDSASGCPSSACSTVTKAVSDATKIKSLPTSLTPPLDKVSTDLRTPTGGTCHEIVSPPSYNPCIYAGSASGGRIALLGDSRAWQWSTSVLSIANRTNSSFGLAFRSSCFITFTVGSIPRNGAAGVAPDPKVCKSWLDGAVAWLNEFNPQTLIVVGSSGTLVGAYEKTFQDGFVPLLKALSAPGRRIVVIGQQPSGNPHGGATCLSTHSGNIQPCGTSLEMALNREAIDGFKASALSVGATYVNPTPWLCSTSSCPPVINGYPVQQDPAHFTSDYAEFLSQILQTAASITGS